ncbi:uncharacterized protein BO80DRAFT_421800 [Aspergillus ibericus CBS 121593]|uniref:Uncharacterized protein n=1 Tax=Aspergillus ibericus CBS 121593 TaxID=1448316 RepID=A0A395HE49_9EURO|nr:hypothetical protein BO80DRAFT_421800 [Aspergillus ibericus CBS 121593]RAL04504.1 hypothetical protein BO80DRAFT_421800 [Aspergillus ibericus CBS 121593]
MDSQANPVCVCPTCTPGRWLVIEAIPLQDLRCWFNGGCLALRSGELFIEDGGGRRTSSSSSELSVDRRRCGSWVTLDDVWSISTWQISPGEGIPRQLPLAFPEGQGPSQTASTPPLPPSDAMTGPSYVDICCLGPGENTVDLKAVVTQELDVNILTRSGFQVLPGLEVQRQEVAQTFYDSAGVPYAVRDMALLYIWKKGEAKIQKHDFYVSTEEAPGSHHQCHVILGTQCIVGRVRDDKGLRIAVTQLKPQNPSESWMMSHPALYIMTNYWIGEKASQEQRKRDKEIALAKKEQERRDREKQQAAQKK